MARGFIKDQRLLDERVSEKDYLSIGDSVETLSEKISTTNESILIGIVGAFGIGKSTLISQTELSRKTANERWIHFDAWQFPDRKELWDGLVLDTAKQLSKLEQIKRRVEGESGKDKKLAVDSAGSIVNVATAAFGLPALLQPLFGMIKNLEYFADKSPARRVFEIQEIFKDIINSIKEERVVFVLEDTDRSGEAGLFFLETFKQFLSATELNKSVVVIVPIANASYYKNIDSYLKCLDYVEFFSKRSKVDLSSFVSEVFESEDSRENDILADFMQHIFTTYPDMNMRKLKLILRQANLNYIDLKRLGYEPNKLICIGVVASKYIYYGDKGETSYFEQFIKTQSVFGGNPIGRLITITNPQFLQYTNVLITNHKGEVQASPNIRLVSRPVANNVRDFPSTPYIGNTFAMGEDGRDNTYLPDFYFKEL